MLQFKTLFCSVFFISAAFALDFTLTTNVDAEISFNGGEAIITKGGEIQNVSENGISSPQTSISVSVKSLNSRYEDSTFTTTLSEYFVQYPAWEADKEYCAGIKVSYNGKSWESRQCNTGDAPKSVVNFWDSPWKEITEDLPVAVVINLTAKELPLDSAFIPIYSEVDASIDISSEIFNETLELKAKTLDTLILPLFSDGTGIGNGTTSKKLAPAKLTSQFGHHLLTLNKNDYKNAEIRLIGINGRVISTEKLSGINQTSLTITNVASGIYLLSVKGINGANFTSKIMHKGGDLRFAASFSGDFEIGGIANSRTLRAAGLRASGINYKLDISYGNNTKVENINAVGGLNENIYVSFLAESFSDLLSEAQYNSIFPNRYGFGRADCANEAAGPGCSQGKPATGPGDGTYDFYSYAAFLQAIELLGEIEVKLEYATDNDYMPVWGSYRSEQKNKRTGVTRVTITYGYACQTSQTGGKIIDLGTVDYGDYCRFGTISDRKHELAASLANMTQETTGYGSIPILVGDDAQPHHWTWGLYWQEETGHNASSGGYRTPDAANSCGGKVGPWDPAADASKSYHGRGAKQLTHPYNYGQFSEFLYGDKSILLDYPERLIPDRVGNEENGVLAFASAIWFWMTPQPPKPSCNEVFRPGFNTTHNGVNYSRMAWTISIINGGLECKGTNTIVDYPLGRVPNRIGHYERYIRILGEEPELSPNGCDNLVID